MYFSKNNKLSKILSLILVCALACTLFAGCESEEAPPETTDSGLNLNLSETTPPPATEPEETKAEEPAEDMGTVTQQMNVRGNPSDRGNPIGTLYAGDRIQIIQVETVVGRLWGRIQEPYDGWVSMDFIEMDVPIGSDDVGSNDTPATTNPVPTTPTTPSTSVKGVITGNGVNIRSEAATNGKIQGSYNKGDVVTILETKDGWGRTDKGWVSMEYVNTTSTNTTTPNTNTGNTNNNATGNGSTTVVAKGVVRVNELNIRPSASTNGDRLGMYRYGDRVEILEKDGGWGRTSKGWIHMDYIYQDGTTGTKTDNGTVTGNGLNIRSGPGTQYDSLGSYNSGDRVKILEQFTYGNTTWGCTNKGWISLAYVDLDNGNNTNNNNTNNTSRTGTGTITDNLNVRGGAGTNYEIVGSYYAGDRVTILEAKNGWGRTSDGWISLNFVDFDSTGSNNSDVEYDGDTRTGTVTRGLNIRNGAGTNYEILGGLEAGTEVTIISIENGWGRIEQGWIFLDYVDLD